MATNSENVAKILCEAVEIDSAEERTQFLDETCADNDELRAQVEQLIRNHFAAGSFLNHPAAEYATEILDGSEKSAHLRTISLDFLQPSRHPDSLGRIGQYEILELVGRGGMGIVLKAHDTKLDRVVAVKVLAPELASNATARTRFLREGQAAAAVSHDHVVTIYAVQEEQQSQISDLPYLVMEFIDGQSLQDKLDAQGPLELKELLRVGRQIASGLAAAHDQGLIHRDVKPSNILLQNGVQRVQITDFGLARAVDDVGITRTGEVAGTPQYMSPEQAQGQRVDSRSDLFSLGSVLYAMCTGRSPFRAESTVAALRRVCDDTPRPIHEVNPEVPEWLVAVIDKLLAKDPDQRYQSAAEVARLLERYLAYLQQPSVIPEPPPPRTSKPRRRRAQQAFKVLRAAAALLLIVGVSLTDAAGLTQVASTVIRIARGDGTLVVHVDDPDVSVSIDGDDIVITGAGVQELRLKPGEHEVRARKNGQSIHQQLVSIERGGRQVVEVRLEPTAPEQPARSNEVQHEQLWTHEGLARLMSISPDGRKVAFRDENTRDLAIRDLATGENRRLTASAPDAEQFTTDAVISPDGQWVAYNWSNDRTNDRETSGLNIIRIDGTETKQVLGQQRHRWIQPRGWTPDGQEILCRLKGDDTTEIAFVGIADGAVRVVKTIDKALDHHPILCLSPDGEYIAYEMPEGDAYRAPGDIFVLSSDGRREYAMGADVDPRDDSILAWTPDASRLMVNRESLTYLIHLVDGQNAGGSALVRNIKSRQLPPGQFSANGDFYYVRKDYPRPDELWVMRNGLPTRPVVPPPPQYDSVWSDPQLVVELFSISPDESVLAFRDNDTGDLAVRNMADGSVRRLTNNTVAWEAYPDNVRVSPDAKYVACEWRSENGQQTDLRVFGVDGGAPKILYEPDGQDVLQARPQDWSHDGRWLLVRLTNNDVKNGTTRIALISTADGSVQILKRPSYRWQGNDGCGLRFSPDGKYIAYEFQPDKGGTDIALMSLDGRHDTKLIENFANDEIIDWTPDGSALLFGSDRRHGDFLRGGYARHAWLIKVANGKAQGEPRAIHGTRGIGEYGEFAADGSLYHVMPHADFVQDVYVATIDPSTGALRKGPVRASQRFAGRTRSAAWSPDGRFLAYYANIAERPESLDLPHKQIIIRSTETGDERAILLPNVYRGRGAWALSGGEMLRWSPDGTSLLLDGFDQGRSVNPNPWGIYQLDVTTGKLTTIDTAEDGKIHLWQHGWSADGTEAVLRRALRDETTVTQQYLRRNLQSGSTIEIHQQRLHRSNVNKLMIEGAVSPDGDRLAILHQTWGNLSVLTMPMAGGEPTQLWQTSDQFYHPVTVGRALAWMRDGKSLVFSQQTRRPIALRRDPCLLELWRISAEGGDPEPLKFAVAGLLNLDIHPDGDRIAYTRLHWNNELRATEILGATSEGN